MSFRRTWRRFRAAPRTLGPTPGVREAWHQGRRWYHVYLLLLEDPAVDARVAEVAGALAPWVTPFATGQAHVTVWVHGFSPPPDHAALGARVPVEIGRLNSFTSCPFLEVRSPALPGLRLGFSTPEERWSAYRPHLTVGRYNADTPIDVLIPALRRWRRLPALRSEARFVHAEVDAFDPSGAFRVLPGDRYSSSQALV